MQNRFGKENTEEEEEEDGFLSFFLSPALVSAADVSPSTGYEYLSSKATHSLTYVGRQGFLPQSWMIHRQYFLAPFYVHYTYEPRS